MISSGEVSAASASAADSDETERGAWRELIASMSSGGGERVPHARTGEPECLGERAQDDDAVRRVDPARRLPAYCGVGLIDDQLTRNVGDLTQFARRIIRSTDVERSAAAGSSTTVAPAMIAANRYIE